MLIARLAQPRTGHNRCRASSLDWPDADDVADQAGVSGGLADQLQAAFDQPGSTRWAAVLLGLVGIVSTGRTLSKVMVASSSLAWRLPTTTKASLKLVGGLVGLIAGIGRRRQAQHNDRGASPGCYSLFVAL